MEHNNLQPNNTYNASFAPNTAAAANQQQGAQPQAELIPPLANAPGLHAHPPARNLQEYNIIRPIEDGIDPWNLPEYQPIQPGLPYMEKLADEAANTKRMERFLKHAQDCEADGDFQDAEKAYKEALKYTESAEHYKLYAGCLRAIYLNLSQIPLTPEKDVANEKEYREKAARAFYYLGDLYQKQGAWKEAQAAYQASCDLALYEAPLQALVDVARQLGDTADIAVALEKLADFYDQKGSIALAIDRLEEAFQVVKSAKILEKLGALYTQEVRPDGRSKIDETHIRLLELQISQDPKNISLYRKYVWFLKDIGKRNEARAVKERMDRLHQANSENLNHLQQKVVKQKNKIGDLKTQVETLEKQVEVLEIQVIHLDFSQRPDTQDADLITLLKKNLCLQSLNLKGCEYLTDAVLDLLPERFENLQELNLTGCKGVTEVGLDAIAKNASKLKRLTLDYCPATTITLLHKLNAKGIAFTIEGVAFKKNVLDLSKSQDLTDEDLLEALQENPEITELNLEKCKEITDAGLAYIKHFQWLKSLKLYDCKKITDEGLSHLTGISQLTLLYLRGSVEITDEGLRLHLTSLSKLEELSLSACNKITDQGLEQLAKLSQLKTLHLRWCKITDKGLEQLAKFSQLERLYLRDCNEITDEGLEQLKGLTQLTTLELSYCSWLSNEKLGKLSGLTQLTWLKLTGCNNLTDAGLQDQFVGLTKLTSLGLYGCNKITNTGLQYLVGLIQLTSLNLGGCNQLTDEGLQQLAKLIQLKTLDLQGCTKVTVEAKEELKRQIPGLTILE